MTVVLAGFRFQLWKLQRSADELQWFVLAPIFTVIFVGLTLSSGREDLVPAAALGSVLICLWAVCLQLGGNIMAEERGYGTLESVVATGAPLRLVVLGRATAVVGLALLVVPEVWLTTLVLFRRAVPVPHPGLFVAALLLTAIGLHAAAHLLTGVCVLARVGQVFQFALSYPFYVLGGLLVPVSMLPGWVRPLTRLVFLSWGSDLLRAALSPAPPTGVAGAVTGLVLTAAVTAFAGQVLITRVVDRVRAEGTLGDA